MTSPTKHRGSPAGQHADPTHELPLDDEPPAEEGLERAEPGLLLVFAASQPASAIVSLCDEALVLGREHKAIAPLRDPMISRQHVRIAYREGVFTIRDLDSRNGSALDGQPIHGSRMAQPGQVLRLGHSLFLLCADVRPFARLHIRAEEGRVEGHALQRILHSIARLADHSRTLFINGESGSGKEALAKAFHRAGPQRGGPFVAVNCATLPEGLAERLLFGAQKGAYSGATHDSEGYVQAANGGTLFLDEIADLDLMVQAKLLRAIESGEVTSLGATRPRKVDLRVCSATHGDLRALVGAGRFRADLYFRLGVPQVRVPPLRERREEIPWLIAEAVKQVDRNLRVHVSLVEACLLRAWPGNVRELLAEAHTAAVAALSVESAAVAGQHLSEAAGTALLPPPPSRPTARVDPETAPNNAEQPPPTKPSDPSFILSVLLAHKGNLSAASRALGLHRTQLRRALARLGVDPHHVRALLRR